MTSWCLSGGETGERLVGACAIHAGGVYKRPSGHGGERHPWGGLGPPRQVNRLSTI